MNNETMEKLNEFIATQHQLIRLHEAELAALTRQRDDLLAALEELATAVKYAHLDSNRYTPGCAVCDALARSDQVVAATGQGEGGA